MAMASPQEYEYESVLRDLGRYGWIQGLEITNQNSKRAIAQYFGGVRYAQAPQQRFRQAHALPPYFTYGTKNAPASCNIGCKVCPQPGWPGILEEQDSAMWSEDCMQANIWIPSVEPPPNGWPILFYIHGGFLQFGEANKGIDIVARLLQRTDLRAVIVMPAYRVGMFGFLASEELDDEARTHGGRAGNMGFWDQRLALEWTARMSSHFSGDGTNITIAGYSAGAHSVFHQLSHDLFLPPEDSLVKRAIMWSNGAGTQPRTVYEQQPMFDSLLSTLKIPTSSSAAEKLALLRSITAENLIGTIAHLRFSQFRGTSDDAFISTNLFSRIENGEYAQLMRKRGVKLFIGECRDEHNLYREWKPPAENSWQALHDRLVEDYPPRVVHSMLEKYAPHQELLPQYANWKALFGHIYADLQVHCLERGFVDRLTRPDGGLIPGTDVFRYRVEKRMGCVDAMWPAEWGVAHATDDAIWWWGNGWMSGLTPEEEIASKPLHEAFCSFVAGDVPRGMAGMESIQHVWRLKQDGNMEFWYDDQWEHGLEVWKAVNT